MFNFSKRWFLILFWAFAVPTPLLIPAEVKPNAQKEADPDDFDKSFESDSHILELDSEETPRSEPPVISSAPIVLSDTPNNRFASGENLEFVIKYEFIAAGHATLETHAGPQIGGRDTLQFLSNASSNKFVDSFFKVRDVNVSIADAKTLYSYKFHQNLKEGRYRVIRNTNIDYSKRKYSFEKEYKGKITRQEGPIDQPVFDILSAFYNARTLPLKLGEQYEITVFSDKAVYPLVVRVDKKLRRVSVPAGKFECIRIMPMIKGDALFKAKGGKMLIWLTNDERRMPVLIRSKVFIGAFDAELTKFTTAP